MSLPANFNAIADLYRSQGGDFDDNGRLRITVTPDATQVADKTQDNINQLADKYGSSNNGKSDQVIPDNVTNLADKYGGDQIKTDTPTKQDNRGTIEKLGTGAVQGVKDVLASGAQGIGWLDSKLLPGGASRYQRFNDIIKQQNDQYDLDNPSSEGLVPNASQVGRFVGQAAATAPLLPARAILGVKAAAGALPTTLATGEKIAAPLVNRLGAASGAGAIGGGLYGAATNSTNDDGMATNVAENTLSGAVGGPVLDRAMAGAKAVLPTISKLISDASTNAYVNSKGVVARSARKLLSLLEDEGMTVNEAEAQIANMGSDATLADTTPTLQKYAGALAQRGGRAQAIVENRYKARNQTADTTAHQIIDRELGPKPDIEAERAKIIDQAHKDVAPDYDAAHTSTDKLDVTPIIKNIDTALESSLGEKDKYLKTVKSFLHRNATDAEGNVTRVPRTSIADLHETRMAIDNILSKSKPPQTSVGNYTKAMLTDMRNSVDEQLKTNPQMKAGDEKFSKAKDVAKGLDYGNHALDKETKEGFDKVWNAASPELKATIKIGLRAKIGDYMDSASRGELAGAQQLFGKKSVNRHMLKTAFGPKGDTVLDALTKQANLRGTEKLVDTGSRTALNQRINADLDRSQGDKGIFSDAIKGVALDVTSGSLGTGTAVMSAKHVGGNIVTRFGEKRHDAMTEGLADLLSRSGKSLTDMFDSLRKIQQAQNIPKQVSSIQGKIKLPGKGKLPVITSGVVGKPIVDSGYHLGKRQLGYE